MRCVRKNKKCFGATFISVEYFSLLWKEFHGKFIVLLAVRLEAVNQSFVFDVAANARTLRGQKKNLISKCCYFVLGSQFL